jgi:hypothetical protein
VLVPFQVKPVQVVVFASNVAVVLPLPKIPSIVAALTSPPVYTVNNLGTKYSLPKLVPVPLSPLAAVNNHAPPLYEVAA